MNKAKIYYHDIGDYLSREEKLKIIKDFGSFATMPLTELHPNEQGDWINMRNDNFENYIPLAPEKKFDEKSQSFFYTYAVGVNTGRDAWCYNFSKESVAGNMKKMISFYNNQMEKFAEETRKKTKLEVERFINTNPAKISWTRSLRNDIKKQKEHSFDDSAIVHSLYRPFTKQNLYFSRSFNEAIGLSPVFFPKEELTNIVICVSPSQNDGLSLLISSKIANLHFNGDTQCFPLYFYEENSATQKAPQLDFGENKGSQKYIRRDAISDFILERAKKQYGLSASGKQHLSKEDIFYYVYGFLHSKTYRETFANDLKKMLPRLPLVEDVRDFWAFSKAGRKLAELHLNYESVAPAKEVIVLYNPLPVEGALKQANREEMEYLNYRVAKMRFPKKGEKGSIIYNNQITIDNIPPKAYEYVVNGKSAIEWIMERYQVKTDKNSGITNDPNDWAKEHNQPRYILNLLLSIINVSVQTVEIVDGLPEAEIGE